MTHKKITTPVFNYRKKYLQGNCLPVVFTAGCQIFEEGLKQPEVKIFDVNLLSLEATEETLALERTQVINWLNEKNYEYFVIDPQINDPSWNNVKTIIPEYEKSEAPPYSVEDVRRIAEKGYCLIVSTIYIPKQEGHAILIYKNPQGLVTVRDPRDETIWDVEQSYDETFEKDYYLGNPNIIRELNEANKENAKNRYLIAFKLEASTPSSTE